MMAYDYLYPRVPMMKTKVVWQKMNVGFSSTLVFLVWTVWGGFLLHILLSNYLAVLTRPVYDKPIRNIDDLIGENF